MAREIAERWIVQGTLRTMTPLHVGGLGADPDTDLPLARDGAGGWHVPGTSLAGAFRAWWTRSFGPEETDRLWGKVPTRGGGRWDGWASHIQIEDAPIVVPGGAPELRDGVGIDRLSGAAAARIKYDRAMLPAGSTLGLAMSIDVAKKQDAAQAEAMLGHFLDALIAGRIHLGAATNRGLGRLALLHAGEDGGPRILRQTLNQRSGMLEALRTGGGSKALEELNRTAATPHPARRLTVELQWESLGPVMTRASLEGLAVDSWPLVGRDGDQVRLLLSGAGVKGVLRSQAERIVRTVLSRHTSGDFLAQVKVPLVGSLFGDTGEGNGALASAAGGLLPGRGALAVADCFSLWSTAPEVFADAVAALDDAGLVARIDTEGFRGWQPAYHVAVDRWTGGAAESLLYTVLEPHGVKWQPLRLTLDLQRIPSSQALAAVALMLLVLNDMAAGKLPLGFAGNRGMGAIAVKAISVDLSELGDMEADADIRAVLEPFVGAKPVAGELIAGLPEVPRHRLAEAWRTWIAAHRVQGGEA